MGGERRDCASYNFTSDAWTPTVGRLPEGNAEAAYSVHPGGLGLVLTGGRFDGDYRYNERTLLRTEDDGKSFKHDEGVAAPFKTARACQVVYKTALPARRALLTLKMKFRRLK